MSNVPPGPSLRGAVDLSGLVRRHASPPPEAGQGEAGSKLSFPAGDADFQYVLQLSARVPVIVEFVAAGLEPALGPVVEGYGGRLVHAVVDAQVNPQVAQAFQVAQVPAVAAIIGGRPLQLFLGIPPEEDVRRVFDDLLRVAEQSGVTGTVPVDGAEGAEGEEPAPAAEPPLPPRHQEAYDAISRGDYDAAIAAYKKALAENPRDEMAAAGLAQVSLLGRLKGADAKAIRTAAAERPDDLEAQLAVADLDVSGGHLEDAFSRLLDLFPSLDPKARETVRTRLLDYFAIAEPGDPRVAAARQRLAMLLY